MKLFLYLWDHVSDKHKIISCTISFMLVVSAFCLVPVPMTTGNVTAARWVYNWGQDIKAEIKTNRVASIERYGAALLEQRTGREVIGMQLRLQALQNDRTHTANDPYLSDAERKKQTLLINERLNNLYRKMDRKDIKLEEIESSNNLMMLADLK